MPWGVAGALTASAGLPKPRPGGLAGPSGRGSRPALFPQLPPLHACEAAAPPQRPWADPPHWDPSSHSLCSTDPAGALPTCQVPQRKRGSRQGPSRHSQERKGPSVHVLAVCRTPAALARACPARAADCAVHRGQSFQVPSQRQYPKTGDCDCRGFSDFLFLSLTASASSLPGAARSVAASQ